MPRAALQTLREARPRSGCVHAGPSSLAYDASADELYVASFGGDRVVRYNADTGEL